jgi:hypothetical protein
MPILNMGAQQQSTPNQQAQPSQAGLDKLGTGFTNVQRLLNANQNSNLGSTVSQGIQNAADTTRNQIQNSVTNFNNGSAANQVGGAGDVQARDSAITNIVGTGDVHAMGGVESGLFQPSPNQSQQSPVTSSYNKLTDKPTDANVSQFQGYLNAQYKGPSSLADESTLQGSAQNAANLGNATQSFAGRQNLLSRFVGSPQYTQGQQGLDSLILGKTGQDQLKAARRDTVGLDQTVQKASQGAQATAQQYQGQAQKFADDTKTALSTAQSGIEAPLNTALQNAQARDSQTTSAVQAWQKQLQSGTTDPNSILSQISQSGLIPADQVAKLKQLSDQAVRAGVDPSTEIYNFLSPTAAQNSTASGLMDEATASKLNALATLSGNTAKYSDPNQIGKYSQAGVSVNTPAATGEYLNLVSKQALPVVNQDVGNLMIPDRLDAAYQPGGALRDQYTAQANLASALPQILKQYEDSGADLSTNKDYQAAVNRFDQFAGKAWYPLNGNFAKNYKEYKLGGTGTLRGSGTVVDPNAPPTSQTPPVSNPGYSK